MICFHSLVVFSSTEASARGRFVLRVSKHSHNDLRDGFAPPPES